MSQKNRYHMVRYVDAENNINMEVIFAFESGWLTVEQMSTLLDLPQEKIIKELHKLEKKDQEHFNELCIECEVVDKNKVVSTERRYDIYLTVMSMDDDVDATATDALQKYWPWFKQQNREFSDLDYYEEREEERKREKIKKKEENAKKSIFTRLFDWLIESFVTVYTKVWDILFSIRLFFLFFWAAIALYNRYDGFGSILVDGEDPQLSMLCMITIFGLAFAIRWLTDNRQKGESSKQEKTHWATISIIALIAVCAAVNEF